MKRKVQIKFGLVNSDVEDALHEWRKRVWAQDFKNAMFGPTGILTNETLVALSSVGPILSLKQLESVVGENWPWFGKYGDNLLTELISLNIPPMIPKPPQTKKTKRTATETTGSVGRGGHRKRQRGSLDNHASTPTPVNLVNAPGPSATSTMPTPPSHPFYPYPSTPSHPLAPPFYPNLIYQNPYHAYMTPSPAPPPMSYYPAFPHTNTPIPPENTRTTHISESQPTSVNFQHYNPESSGSSRYNPS